MRTSQLPRLTEPVFSFLPFEGGKDEVTPSLSTKPGTCRSANNFEVGINWGYERIVGYERYDGRPRPSEQTYSIIDVTITGTISVGDTITGVSSGATAVVLAVVTNATPNYLVVTKVAGGPFQNPEDLNVSAVKEGETLSVDRADGASTAQLHAQYRNLAADEYRNDIAAVPGAGPVRGVWMYNDIRYAFRNNAGQTECKMHKSSGTGWTEIALGLELSFTSGGTYEVMDGDTITGQISGETAVVGRVVLESGSWAAGTAAGRFVFASQSGPFQAEDLDVGPNANVATIAGDSTAITLLPGGRYEFVNHNFGGSTGTLRMYGVDKVNRGFEFDGTTFVPIQTGMTDDTPDHVTAHQNHLFFSFDASVQHSGIGKPYVWTPVLGASELAMGKTVTAFQKEPGRGTEGALGIYSRNKIEVLYGTSAADWSLIPYREEIGAYAYTVQQIGLTIMLDDRGIAKMTTTQAFGNFEHSTISRLVQPTITAKRSIASASCLVRDKNQYRLFFSDKSALYVTFDNHKVMGIMPINFDHPVECCFSLEDSSGSEVIAFGSDDGFVYEMERGTSFDGNPIPFELNLHFHHAGSPRVKKSFKGCALEVDGDGYSEFDFTYELGYGDVKIAQPPANDTKVLNFSASRWDSFTWDSFFWDGTTLSQSEADLTGSAENISLIIKGSSDYFAPTKFSGALIRYLPRRHLRA